MRLILLPAQPGPVSGYTRVVAEDVARLRPGAGDRVLVRRGGRGGMEPGWIMLPNPSRTSPWRVVNVARGRASGEVLTSQLAPHCKGEFSEVWCGDIVFYRALRELMPDRRITVRLHNVYALLRERQRKLRYRLGPIFRANLVTLSRLEERLFRDAAASLIFITDADCDYYRRHHGGAEAEVWSMATPPAVETPPPTRLRLLYLGSLPSHQLFAMRYFVRRVFPEIRVRLPGIELHLHGRGSGRFDDPEHGVHGHGAYDNEGPPGGGDGLFVNPDLLGGGQKVKVADWLSWGVPFISTPFGIDGYDVAPHPHRLVAEVDEWPDLVAGYFAKLGVSRA